MNAQPLMLQNQYPLDGLKRFLELLTIRKCTYYASDFLGAEIGNPSEIEEPVQRTLEVFKTLEVPTEEHFYMVYRSGSGSIYKDWKISGLACVYMLMNGDPTDLRAVARQQSELIDQMLQHIHPQQISKSKDTSPYFSPRM